MLSGFGPSLTLLRMDNPPAELSDGSDEQILDAVTKSSFFKLVSVQLRLALFYTCVLILP